MITGLGIVDEFALNGPWVVFTEINPGPFLNQQVYFDTNRNEYVTGTGPTPLLGSSGSLLNFVDPTTGTVNLAPTNAPIIPATSSANVVPVTTNSIEDFFNSLPGGSTISTILSGSVLGFPNWIAIAGVLGFFLISETKGRFGK